MENQEFFFLSFIHRFTPFPEAVIPTDLIGCGWEKTDMQGKAQANVWAIHPFIVVLGFFLPRHKKDPILVFHLGVLYLLAWVVFCMYSDPLCD